MGRTKASVQQLPILKALFHGNWDIFISQHGWQKNHHPRWWNNTNQNKASNDAEDGSDSIMNCCCRAVYHCPGLLERTINWVRFYRHCSKEVVNGGNPRAKCNMKWNLIVLLCDNMFSINNKQLSGLPCWQGGYLLYFLCTNKGSLMLRFLVSVPTVFRRPLTLVGRHMTEVSERANLGK